MSRYKKKLITVENITKTFGTKIVLKGISFDIYENQFVSILGPSGCGKTTTLKILSGFEEPTSGSITYEGKDLIQIPVFKRPFNTVFQSYALFPNMNVFDNISYGLKIKKKEKLEIEDQVKRILKIMHLEEQIFQNIDTLSGGQKQRVALARALINKPKILLLDEPLGALDAKIKESTKFELKRLQKEFGITFIYVTHDQEEALTMSDQVIVMKDGKVEQIGTPLEIYDEPNNSWVANFVGTSNIIKSGRMIKDNKVEFFGKTFYTTSKGFGNNEKVDIMIRPEDFITCDKKNSYLSGKIKEKIFAGVFWENKIEIEYENNKHILLMNTINNYELGQNVNVKWDDDAIHVMWKNDREYVQEN